MLASLNAQQTNSEMLFLLNVLIVIVLVLLVKDHLVVIA